MVSEGANRRSEEWDSISPLVSPRCSGNHERSRERFCGWVYIRVEVSDKGLLKPPEVIGGTDVTVEYCPSIGFWVYNIVFSHRRMDKIGVVGIGSRAIALRGS